MKDFIEFLDHESLWSPTIIYSRNKLLNHEEPVLYYIIDGAVTISTNIQEQEQIIRLGYADSIITKLDDFFGKTPSIYTIKTIKETKFKLVEKDKVIQKIKEKDTYSLWIKVLENLILQQTEREIDLLCQSASERYSRLLERSPQIFQQIPHKYIASYLRISPETLSRLQKS